MTTTAAVPGLDTAAAVLEHARDRRRAADAAEADLLQDAVTWADLHPAESITDAVRFGDTPVPVAGPGAPLVAEFCVAEFAAALRLPTEAGKAYLGEAVGLRYRLPRIWARVVAGDLAAWRARRIARQTIGLSLAAAGFVDAQVAPFAHRIRPSGVDRLVQEAIVRFMPEEARRRREGADDGRHVYVHTHQVSFEGTVWMEAEVDLADALDLDTALSAGAARLADLGSTSPLDVRRSEALGEMARHQLTLDLDSTDTGTETPAPTPGRQVVLHVHLSEDAITGPTTQHDDRLHLARVANTRTFVDAEQVRTWCGHPGTRVTVKPVLDLAEQIHVNRYEVPDRLAAQATERDLTCVFPWCTRPAAGCDLDHVIPYSQGGATSSENIAPLCRRHHRRKTHHPGWGYTVLEPGSYLWQSPHGYQFLRDHRGTTDLTHARATQPPDG